jgi:Spy/CpxP family protein refolding chaperone
MAATALIAHERGEAREGRHGPGTEAVKGALNLSDEQVAALKQNNQELREAMHAVFEQAAEKHKALRAELESENPNPTIIGQMALDAHEAREQASGIRAEFREKALNVLDAQQKSALSALAESEERSPALREAGMLNLIEGASGGFGKGMRHGPRGGGFPGGPRG